MDPLLKIISLLQEGTFKKYVVYRFLFEDKAAYIGQCLSRRIGVRWGEHHTSEARGINQPLQQRLRAGNGYVFDILSSHDTEAEAEEAENEAIKQHPRVLNRISAGANEFYKEEKRRLQQKPITAKEYKQIVKWVVYQITLENGWHYVGESSYCSAPSRWHTHFYTKKGNLVLNHLVENEAMSFQIGIASTHSTKQEARNAEDSLIRSLPGIINEKANIAPKTVPNSVYRQALSQFGLEELDKSRKEKMSSYISNRTKKQKEKGLCSKCNNPVEEHLAGQTLCAACKTKYANRRKARKKAGLCRKCNAPLEDDRKDKDLCKVCTANAVEYVRDRVRKGLCSHCGNPIEENRKKKGTGTCGSCAAKMTEYGESRKRKGLCTSCGKPIEEARKGKSKCAACTDSYLERRRKQVAQGLCSQCGGDMEEDRKGMQLCSSCQKQAGVRSKSRREMGICTGCGKPREESRRNKSECEACTEKRRKRREEKKTQGLCQCGRVLEKERRGKTTCSICAARSSSRSRARRNSLGPKN